MRELGSCFSEYAVQISDSSSCSSYNSTNSCISAASLVPSIQHAVTSSYRTLLSTEQKQILITVSWCDTLSHGLSISFGEGDSSTAFKLMSKNSRLFRKLMKGSRSMEFNGCRVEILWDLSAAKYRTGPEPVDGYYILIMVDRELVLFLGDRAQEAAARKLKPTTRKAKSSLISRQEHYSGNTLYSTRARFSDAGADHDIVIRCSGESEGFNKHPALSVSVDKRTVVRIKRLQWNFRGNQTIFLDGLLVDLMWDVHDWFYNPVVPGCAVFMFRTRSGMDSRLWLEEKMVQKDHEDNKIEFSLLIYGCKNT